MNGSRNYTQYKIIGRASLSGDYPPYTTWRDAYEIQITLNGELVGVDNNGSPLWAFAPNMWISFHPDEKETKS